MKKQIKNFMFHSDLGKHMFYQSRRIRERIDLSKESDLKYIERVYKERFGESICWEKPQTFQAKLQWLKLFYRDWDMPVCSDKYNVREYLSKMDLEWLANDVIGVYTDARDIDFDSLPQRFVAKATHGSGWNLICEDKDKLNWKSNQRILNDWLKLNLYVFGREWNYKDITPQIIIERFIENRPLNDYKYMCFNGEPLYMQINNDYAGTHFVDFYRIENWEHLDSTYGPYKYSKDRMINKPSQHERMMELARILSKQFPFVRVDFYNFDDVIILGELTFFPGGGLWPFMPREKGNMYDVELGKCLTLPEPNHNLELLSRLSNK